MTYKGKFRQLLIIAVAILIFIPFDLKANSASSTSQEIKNLKKIVLNLEKRVLALEGELASLEEEQSLLKTNFAKLDGLKLTNIKFANLGSGGCPVGSIPANNQGVSVVTRSFGSEGTIGIGTCQIQVLSK
jgi:exonuclease VII small subunit